MTKRARSHVHPEEILMTAIDRFNDLQKQGFMKFKAPKKAPVKRPTVACDACLNWHLKGKHTANAVARRANLAGVTP